MFSFSSIFPVGTTGVWIATTGAPEAISFSSRLALLLALADLSIEHGNDSGAPPRSHHEGIAGGSFATGRHRISELRDESGEPRRAS